MAPVDGAGQGAVLAGEVLFKGSKEENEAWPMINLTHYSKIQPDFCTLALLKQILMAEPSIPQTMHFVQGVSAYDTRFDLIL